MIKKLTGRKIDAKDFKLLNQCVECGYATNIKYGKKCPLCELIDRPRCEFCEIVLRYKKITYAYDHNEKLRDGEQIKISKQPIKEFIIFNEPASKQYSNTICEDCHLLQEKLKLTYKTLRCKICNKKLSLTEDEYLDYIKKNGQLCYQCLFKYEYGKLYTPDEIEDKIINGEPIIYKINK